MFLARLGENFHVHKNGQCGWCVIRIGKSTIWQACDWKIGEIKNIEPFSPKILCDRR